MAKKENTKPNIKKPVHPPSHVAGMTEFFLATEHMPCLNSVPPSEGLMACKAGWVHYADEAIAFLLEVAARPVYDGAGKKARAIIKKYQGKI